MRPLLLVLALLATPAFAQEASGDAQSVLVLLQPAVDAPLQAPEATVERPSPLAGRVVLGLAGISVGAGVMTFAANEGSVPLALLAPLASGGAVYVLGEAMGYGGDADRTLVGTALGALPGLAVMVVGFTMDAPGADDWISEGTVVVAIGALTYVVGGSIGAVLGYSGGAGFYATAQRAPAGETVPSLGFRVRL